MLNIIMVSGHKGAGKDYVSEKLSNLIPDSKVISFAEPLKDIISTTMGITLEELDAYKNDSRVITLKRTGQRITDFRSILQKFGTDAMKKHFGANVWVDLLINKLPSDGVVIISDWRFKHEFHQLDRCGEVTTVRVQDNNLSGDGHLSEIDLDGFDFDHVLDNTAKVDLKFNHIIMEVACNSI